MGTCAKHEAVSMCGSCNLCAVEKRLAAMTAERDAALRHRGAEGGSMKRHKWLTPYGTTPQRGYKWPVVGEWHGVEGKLKACKNGLHVMRVEHLVEWMYSDVMVLWEVECQEVVKGEEKDVCRSARLVRKVGRTDARTMRHLAADFAERTLHIFEKESPNDDRPRKAIKAARDFGDGKIGDAARAAAWAAAWAAAGDAARAAAWDAARAAAWAAEKKWQGKRIIEQLTAAQRGGEG